ncbi:MAG: hypothetical protein V5A34_03710 [Halapricum sp.]
MRDRLDLEPVELAQLLLVAIVVVALLVSGPVIPGVSLTGAEPTSLGEGDATVSSVTVDADRVRITPGRFGTNISYLRVPDARLQIDTIEGQPRVVYQLRIPELDIDLAAPKLLSESGRTTVRLDDQAIAPERLSQDQYEGQLVVRIQSLSTDRVVRNESITVEVRR